MIAELEACGVTTASVCPAGSSNVLVGLPVTVSSNYSAAVGSQFLNDGSLCNPDLNNGYW